MVVSPTKQHRFGAALAGRLNVIGKAANIYQSGELHCAVFTGLYCFETDERGCMARITKRDARLPCLILLPLMVALLPPAEMLSKTYAFVWTASQGSCSGDTWSATSTSGAPTQRGTHTAVWTGSEMIIWGGYDHGVYLNTGGRYDPATDSWRSVTTVNAPSGRRYHVAVWTGREMIVWGGSDSSTPFLATGGAYDPIFDTWRPISQVNAPSARYAHTAVWTGSEMIVWGGNVGSELTNTGARYDPASDRWTAIRVPAGLEGRRYHSAVWTDTEMIVWGGQGNTTAELKTGGRYNPSNDSWTATSTVGAPGPRDSHTAVWTGTDMLVWGGSNDTYPYYLGDGTRYHPATDSWVPITSANAPSPRSDHTAVWTGADMILWGGTALSGSLGSGGKYTPSSESWTSTSAVNSPSGRYYHSAVWTGSEMTVWGGGTNTGGRYCDGAATQCALLVSPASVSFGSSGGTGSLSINTTAGCGWTASSNAAWLVITSAISGNRSGTLSYSVANNTSSSSRTAGLTVNGQTCTVSQGGESSCFYSISPTSKTFRAAGGSSTIDVSAQPTCSWSASTSVSWIVLNSSSGSGAGSVPYTVGVNSTGAVRKGKIFVAGQVFSVKQRAG